MSKAELGYHVYDSASRYINRPAYKVLTLNANGK
jgi:hypothetical protein